MGCIASFALIVSAAFTLAQCGVDDNPPSQLVELANELRVAGGDVHLDRVERYEWELAVDFLNKIKDDALKPLHNQRGVTAIRILKGGVSDKGLSHLKNLPDLRLLVVKSKEITDEGMVTVGALKGLTKLDIIQPRLSDKGLEALVPLVNLSELFLYGAEIHDRDVEPLKKMRKLQRLDLPSTVTQTKFEELQRCLPTTQVKKSE